MTWNSCTSQADGCQILASTSTGAIHVLYSPRSSIRGALLPLQKMPKSAPRDLSFSTATGVPVIMTPHALPMFADEDYTAEKRKRNRESKLRKPMEPVYGAGKNGRIGSSATQPMVAHLFRNGVPKDEDVSDYSGHGCITLTWPAERSPAAVCDGRTKRQGEEAGRGAAGERLADAYDHGSKFQHWRPRPRLRLLSAGACC